MLGPCWQPLFALNSLAPNHSAIRLATLSIVVEEKTRIFCDSALLSTHIPHPLA